MGCTSSAPNMADSQTSTTDNLENILKTEDSVEIARENEFNSNGHQNLHEKQVLPECEVEFNQTELDRNNTLVDSDEDNSNLHTVDVQVFAPTELNENNIDNIEVSQIDEHHNIKDFVDKEISETAGENEQKINNAEEIKAVEKQIEKFGEVNDTEKDEEFEDKDDKESPSPTQSEDSRATRWEALADIAAELPPSLAVDPLTGQIYTLTK